MLVFSFLSRFLITSHKLHPATSPLKPFTNQLPRCIPDHISHALALLNLFTGGFSTQCFSFSFHQLISFPSFKSFLPHCSHQIPLIPPLTSFWHCLVYPTLIEACRWIVSVFKNSVLCGHAVISNNVVKTTRLGSQIHGLIDSVSFDVHFSLSLPIHDNMYLTNHCFPFYSLQWTFTDNLSYDLCEKKDKWFILVL